MGRLVLYKAAAWKAVARPSTHYGWYVRSPGFLGRLPLSGLEPLQRFVPLLAASLLIVPCCTTGSEFASLHCRAAVSKQLPPRGQQHDRTELDLIELTYRCMVMKHTAPLSPPPGAHAGISKTPGVTVRASGAHGPRYYIHHNGCETYPTCTRVDKPLTLS